MLPTTQTCDHGAVLADGATALRLVKTKREFAEVVSKRGGDYALVHGQHVKFVTDSLMADDEAVAFVRRNGRFGVSLEGLDASAVLVCLGHFEMHSIPASASPPAGPPRRKTTGGRRRQRDERKVIMAITMAMMTFLSCLCLLRPPVVFRRGGPAGGGERGDGVRLEVADTHGRRVQSLQRHPEPSVAAPRRPRPRRRP